MVDILNHQLAEPSSLGKKPAIVLVNTGSPPSLQIEDVKNYLKEFLADPYVIESPFVRWLLRHLIIPFYAKQSAEKYRLTSTPSGFLLTDRSQQLASALQTAFDDLKIGVDVHLAMRYGDLSLSDCIKKLATNDRNIFLVPLFPQYSQSTTASIVNCAQKAMSDKDYLPNIFYLRDFYETNSYIDAQINQIRQHWQENGPSEKLLFSFHAIPASWPSRYTEQCKKTVSLIADRLQLKHDQFCLVYQSRFGKGAWSTPELDTVVSDLAKAGTNRLDIICPGFICDNLETAFDIDIQAKKLFLSHGGKQFYRIGCLNNQSDWITSFAKTLACHFSIT